jgi:hypothetical protein
MGVKALNLFSILYPIFLRCRLDVIVESLGANFEGRPSCAVKVLQKVNFVPQDNENLLQILYLQIVISGLKLDYHRQLPIECVNFMRDVITTPYMNKLVGINTRSTLVPICDYRKKKNVDREQTRVCLSRKHLSAMQNVIRSAIQDVN